MRAWVCWPAIVPIAHSVAARLAALAALCACSAALGAGAQEGEAVFRTGSRLVAVSATVLDRKGRYVDGLGVERFLVTDDGAPRPIVSVEGGDARLSTAILLDTTASMREALPIVKNAVVRLIGQMREQDSLAVFAFDTSVRTIVDFTTDKQAARAAVMRIRTGGATALYDALTETARGLEARTGKKALVVFSDGDDNSSMLSARDAMTRVRKEGVPIYTIAEGEALNSEGLLSQLKQISSVSGGLTYQIRKPEDAERVFLDISNDMRHAYLILYRPPEAENRKWRAIQVKVPGNESYSVRAREGYYPK
jgi:Ca-activated chloride channel family protein